MLVPLVLAQFPCSSAATMRNVAVSRIASDVCAAASGARTALSSLHPVGWPRLVPGSVLVATTSWRSAVAATALGHMCHKRFGRLRLGLRTSMSAEPLGGVRPMFAGQPGGLPLPSSARRGVAVWSPPSVVQRREPHVPGSLARGAVRRSADGVSTAGGCRSLADVPGDVTEVLPAFDRTTSRG